MNNWYIVYTYPSWEKKVALFLKNKKIESYCPLNTALMKKNDKRKKVQVPLFLSYVFVKTDENMLGELKKINGIINVVYWLKEPVVIKEEEIETIRNFLSKHRNVKVEKLQVDMADEVRITSSPLHSEGNMLTVSRRIVKLFLPSLGYQIVAIGETSTVQTFILNDVSPVAN